jgi:hypothetical protein
MSHNPSIYAISTLCIYRLENTTMSLEDGRFLRCRRGRASQRGRPGVERRFRLVFLGAPESQQGGPLDPRSAPSSRARSWRFSPAPARGGVPIIDAHFCSGESGSDGPPPRNLPRQAHVVRSTHYPLSARPCPSWSCSHSVYMSMNIFWLEVKPRGEVAFDKLLLAPYTCSAQQSTLPGAGADLGAAPPPCTPEPAHTQNQKPHIPHDFQ